MINVGSTMELRKMDQRTAVKGCGIALLPLRPAQTGWVQLTVASAQSQCACARRVNAESCCVAHYIWVSFRAST